MTRVLVAYATKHGSTGEIAEAIGAALRQCGVDAEVRPVKDVVSVHGLDGVVLGSAVYMNQWRADAVDFLKRFQADLASLPVWLFSSGPTGGTADADAKVADLLAAQPPAPGEAGRRGRQIGVRGHATFGGRVVPEMGGFFERWMPRGDWRDFTAIRAWAAKTAAELHR